MLQSMTAFARVQHQLDSGLLCWEIRSVNHRYLDVSFRMPDVLRFVEMDLRNQLRDVIHRGKLECSLKFQDTNTHNPSMLIDRGLVNALVHFAQELADTHQLANDLTVSSVLAWPGVVQTGSLDTETLAKDVSRSFAEAIAQLQAMRQGEGRILAGVIEDKLQQLRAVVAECRAHMGTLADKVREKWQAKIVQLPIEVAEDRLEQEVAMILMRLDVMEELDRLETHLTEVAQSLKSGKSVGRRLDFLMQELNREANTLSSKSDSAELTRRAVEMKVLIEQMREQIQNIE